MHKYVMAGCLVIASGCTSLVLAQAPVTPPPTNRCLDERDILRGMVRELRSWRDQADVSLATLGHDRDMALERVKTLTHENEVARKRLLELAPDPGAREH